MNEPTPESSGSAWSTGQPAARRPERDAAGSRPPAAEPARRLAHGTGWQALSQTLPLVFNLALTPFVIHGLGVELYGVFLLVAVIQVFVSSVDGGIGPGARRYFGIYAGRDDRTSITSLLVTLLVLMAASPSWCAGSPSGRHPRSSAFFPGAAADAAGATFLLRVMIVIVAVAQARSLFTQVLWTSNKFQLQAAGDLLGFFVYATGMVLTVVNGYGLDRHRLHTDRPAGAVDADRGARPRCSDSTGPACASSHARC